MSTDDNDSANPKRRVRENLPWRVTGRLSEAEHAEVDSALKRDASLASERRWIESLRTHLRSEIALPDEDAGLDTLLARIHGEQSRKVVSLEPSLWQRWQRPAFAIAATVMLAQAAVIGVIFQSQSATESIAPLSGQTQPASGAVLQITFQGTATETQIRTALIEARVELSGGPSALGIYTVRVISGSREIAAKKLRAAAAVEGVTLP